MRLGVMVLALLSSFALAEGQTANPVDGPNEIDEIVARHVEALGGIDRLRAIHSVRMKGRVTAGGGREALVVREVQRSDRVRTEFTYQGVTAVFAFDGKTGWKVSPFEGSLSPEPMEDEAADEAGDQADIEGPIVDWKAKGNRVTLVGKETLGDRDVHKLEVTLRSGRVVHQYLDAKTFLRVRAESTRRVRGSLVDIETTFDDYREVEGVLFPFSIETGAVGRPQRLKIGIEAIEVNPSLDEARFQMPALER